MHVEREVTLNADGMQVGIAVSRYHHELTDALCAAAVACFEQAGGVRGDLTIVPVSGAFELTTVCRALAARPDLDGVVALGCVIRGETMHDQYICQSVAQGLTSITLETGKPVAFGLLTCHTRHQAGERAGGAKGNKGVEAMTAVIETIQTLRSLSERERASGATTEVP